MQICHQPFGKSKTLLLLLSILVHKYIFYRCRHLFVSTLHFHDEAQVVKYRQQLQDWVKGNVSMCKDSLFIIDEIDKMPSGVLDGLKPFMDFHSNVDGIDFRRATFILLSNTGGREITRRTMEFWQDGKRRESMTYFDFEGKISLGNILNVKSSEITNLANYINHFHCNHFRTDK